MEILYKNIICRVYYLNKYLNIFVFLLNRNEKDESIIYFLPFSRGVFVSTG